jgi:cell division protein ZapA
MSASSKRTDKPSKADKSDRSGKKEGSLVPVVIFGQTYSVRADEDGSYIEELARYVDTKMRTLAESTGTSDSLKVAVLAALNIADEFFKLEQGQKSGEAEIAATADELTKALDESLREPTSTSPALS